MPLLNIVVEMVIVADVPDQHLPDPADPQSHDLIHGLTRALFESLPCAAFSTPEKDEKGGWVVDLKAQITMDSDGRADMVLSSANPHTIHLGEHVH